MSQYSHTQTHIDTHTYRHTHPDMPLACVQLVEPHLQVARTVAHGLGECVNLEAITPDEADKWVGQRRCLADAKATLQTQTHTHRHTHTQTHTAAHAFVSLR